MKKLLLSIVLLSSVIYFAQDLNVQKRVDTDCKCKSIKLYGKVKVVKHNPDFKVKVVPASSADLRVQKVERFPDACGKWQFVDINPDFTIQYVDVAPDFNIHFVKHNPGLPTVLP